MKTTTEIQTGVGKLAHDAAFEAYPDGYPNAENIRWPFAHGFHAGYNHVTPELLEALKSLFGMVEAGTLVRDISHDADPKWYLAALELTKVIGDSKAAISKAEGQQ